MGQLCCFPFSRGEEKIKNSGTNKMEGFFHFYSEPHGGEDSGSEKRAAEPDDAELLSLSKRLVENAVLKAVQQYLEETQNKTRQTDGSPAKTEEAASSSKNESDRDN
ncbi:A-kinase anchor protein 7 isoforms alpha and beta, partial [Acanthisitta chloris]